METSLWLFAPLGSSTYKDLICNILDKIDIYYWRQIVFVNKHIYQLIMQIPLYRDWIQCCRGAYNFYDFIKNVFMLGSIHVLKRIELKHLSVENVKIHKIDFFNQHPVLSNHCIKWHIIPLYQSLTGINKDVDRWFFSFLFPLVHREFESSKSFVSLIPSGINTDSFDIMMETIGEEHFKYCAFFCQGFNGGNFSPNIYGNFIHKYLRKTYDFIKKDPIWAKAMFKNLSDSKIERSIYMVEESTKLQKFGSPEIKFSSHIFNKTIGKYIFDMDEQYLISALNLIDSRKMVNNRLRLHFCSIYFPKAIYHMTYRVKTTNIKIFLNYCTDNNIFDRKDFYNRFKNAECINTLISLFSFLLKNPENDSECKKIIEEIIEYASTQEIKCSDHPCDEKCLHRSLLTNYITQVLLSYQQEINTIDSI